MRELDYTYWKSENWFIGFLNDYPEQQTEGKTIDELEEMLLSIYNDIQNYPQKITNTSHKFDGKLVINET